ALEDGRQLRAPLLVAADSRFSASRRAMGIPVAMHDFGRTMLVSRVRLGRPHEGVAWEWFGQGQTRALLPLNDGLASAVLTVPGAEAARLQALAPEAYGRALQARYRGRFGAMGLEGAVHAYPLAPPGRIASPRNATPSWATPRSACTRSPRTDSTWAWPASSAWRRRWARAWTATVTRGTPRRWRATSAATAPAAPRCSSGPGWWCGYSPTTARWRGRCAARSSAPGARCRRCAAPSPARCSTTARWTRRRCSGCAGAWPSWR